MSKRLQADINLPRDPEYIKVIDSAMPMDRVTRLDSNLPENGREPRS
jgi:hypothetical protein